jgi:hypothetical protein
MKQLTDTVLQISESGLEDAAKRWQQKSRVDSTL